MACLFLYMAVVQLFRLPHQMEKPTVSIGSWNKCRNDQFNYFFFLPFYTVHRSSALIAPILSKVGVGRNLMWSDETGFHASSDRCTVTRVRHCYRHVFNYVIYWSNSAQFCPCFRMATLQLDGNSPVYLFEYSLWWGPPMATCSAANPVPVEITKLVICHRRDRMQGFSDPNNQPKWQSSLRCINSHSASASNLLRCWKKNVGTGRLEGTAFNDRYGSVTQMTRLPVRYFPFWGTSACLYPPLVRTLSSPFSYFPASSLLGDCTCRIFYNEQWESVGRTILPRDTSPVVTPETGKKCEENIF